MNTLEIRLAAGGLAATAVAIGVLVATGALTARGGSSDIELPGLQRSGWKQQAFGF